MTDDSIQEIMPINPLTFYWREGMSLDVPSLDHHWEWNRYAENVKKRDRWVKLLNGRVNLKDVAETVISRLAEKALVSLVVVLNGIKRRLGMEVSEDLAHDLDQIHARGIKVNFIFADLDPGYKILMESAGHVVERLTKNKAVEISFIAKANHNFSSHLGRSRLLAKVTQYFSSRYD